MKKFLLGLLMLPMLAQAGATSGVVQDLYVHEDGLVLFNLSNPLASPPAPECSSGSYNFAFSLLLPAGREMYAMVLASETTQRPVIASYFNCHGQRSSSARARTIQFVD